MTMDQLTTLLPYPLRDFDRLSLPPTTPELRTVLPPLLEQCESLAASLHGGLHGAEHCGEDPARFVPTALLLQETLQLVLALVTAWAQHGAAQKEELD